MAFFKIKLNFEFFLIYFLQLHGEQLSILHSQLLTRLLYYMSPNMVYTRIIGSRQIGNYLAGHVPPNRKLFGGTVPPNSLPNVFLGSRHLKTDKKANSLSRAFS